MYSLRKRLPKPDVDLIFHEALVVHQAVHANGFLCLLFAAEGQKDGDWARRRNDRRKSAHLRPQQRAIPPPCARIGRNSIIRRSLRGQSIQDIRCRVCKRKGECNLSFSFVQFLMYYF